MAGLDFATNGWKRHDERGFLGLIGPVWEKHGEQGLMLAIQADERHENLRGGVQGGMLMTLADRTIGAFARTQNEDRPHATVQLDVHFLAVVRIGDVVVGRARMIRDTKALMFLGGELAVGQRIMFSARGVWKRLDL